MPNWFSKLRGGSPDRTGSGATIAAGHRAYAVGDIHGRLDLLDDLLARIEEDNRSRQRAKTHLVFLGDLIDRGPSSAQVIERLRTYRSPGIEPIFLAGNHEEVLLRILEGDQGLVTDWLRFGGAECLASYGLDPKTLASTGGRGAVEAIRAAIPDQHVQFLRNLSDTVKIGDYLFVHAGIRPGVHLSLQLQQDLRWIRRPFLDDESDHGFVVVHGHTITTEVDERPNRIGIDTGAYVSGRLTALGLEGRNRWYLATSGTETDLN